MLYDVDPQPPAPDRTLIVVRWLVTQLPLALYLLIGALGASWISDDFDNERLPLMAYFAVPLAVLYYGLLALYPGWRRRWPRAYRTMIATLLLCFTCGVIPLINAVTASQPRLKRTVQAGGGIVMRDERRGGLGLLFRQRW